MENIEALQKVCTPVVVELYGHGRSPAPEEKSAYYPDNYLAQFELIREEIGCENWFLCGYSLGAGLTIKYALEYPERVVAHLFTNSTSGFSTLESRLSLLDNETEILEKYRVGGINEVDRIAVHPRNAKKIPVKVKQALLKDCELLNPMGVARTLLYTNGRVSVRDEVSNNSRDALLICGSQEKRFLPFKAFAISNMPLLRVIEMDAGHAVNAEAAADFNAQVAGFIKEHTE